MDIVAILYHTLAASWAAVERAEAAHPGRLGLGVIVEYFLDEARALESVHFFARERPRRARRFLLFFVATAGGHQQVPSGRDETRDCVDRPGSVPHEQFHGAVAVAEQAAVRV